MNKTINIAYEYVKSGAAVSFKFNNHPEMGVIQGKYVKPELLQSSDGARITHIVEATDDIGIFAVGDSILVENNELILN